MSQANFIQAILRHVSGPDVLDAVTESVDPTTGRENIGIYLASSLAAGVPRVRVFTKLIDYVFNIDASERQKLRLEWQSQVIDTIVSECKMNPLAPDEEVDADLRTAIERIVAADAIESFMALDQVGLIDRSAAYTIMKMRSSPLMRYFSEAVAKGANRCVNYLLATSARELVPSFPQEERTWSGNLEMARDIAFAIPDEDVARNVEVLADMQAPENGRRHEVHSKAECVTIALLERQVEATDGALTPAGKRLLAAAVERSINGMGNGMDKKAERALLGILFGVKQLHARESLLVARRVLRAENEGTAELSPDFLRSLLDAGLPVQSEPGWLHGGKVAHLIDSASARQMDVLAERVTDKTGFMREFGVDVALAHSGKPDHSAGNLKGSQNAELMRLAELGFPFGPIELTNAEGGVDALAVYERFTQYDSYRAADAFIVGHLAGHLGPEHTYDGADPMHVAVAYKSAETVVSLAKHGFALDEPCCPNKTRYDTSGGRSFHQYAGMTPLIMALKIGDAEDSERLVRALIDSGADPSIKAPTGASAIQLAKTPEMKELLRSGATLRKLKTALDGDQPASTKPVQRKASLGIL
jgi:hypothetical protein